MKVLREKVKVSIHHRCGTCSVSHNFNPPSHSYVQPQPHTNTHTCILLAIHQELTLKINPIMHHTSPLWRTTSLTYSTAHIAALTDKVHIYSSLHACKETCLIFVWSIFYPVQTKDYRRDRLKLTIPLGCSATF